MNVIKEFLFGRNDLLEDLEEDAEKDMQVLQDIFFLHKQKMDAIRELFHIWEKKSNIEKIDKLGKGIKDYNEKLIFLVRRMLRIQSQEESVVKLLIARNEEFAGEFEVYDIKLLLQRMEGELRLLGTILNELNFIIGEQIRYSKKMRC